MSRPVALRARLIVGGLGAALLLSTTAAVGTGGSAAGAAGAAQRAPANVVTPGDFTGYGFDQCLAPSQKAMNTWLRTSPFLAVGVYISGNSRGCRSQPNLTPRWIRTQLKKGWRLLPITLGPQASCQPRFPRYDDDPTIRPRPGKHGRYHKARVQGRAEASKSVAVAARLGIAPRSTLWYDLEGFDYYNTRCRESALAFLSGWTTRIRALGYRSGVYSSAGSGMLALDNARVNRPGVFAMPDQIWVARWDGVANTSTSYLRNDGWRPHARVKQYQGGHNETWGGVTINIDRDFLDVGRGSFAPQEVYCGGVRLGYGSYARLAPATDRYTPPVAQVKALQCLLHQQGLYDGAYHGRYTAKTLAGVNAWQDRRDLTVRPMWTHKAWVSLLSAGRERPVLKFGSAGSAVRRLQRALNAARASKSPLVLNGVFDAATGAAVRAWQHNAGVQVTGVFAGRSWVAINSGKY